MFQVKCYSTILLAPENPTLKHPCAVSQDALSAPKGTSWVGIEAQLLWKWYLCARKQLHSAFTLSKRILSPNNGVSKGKLTVQLTGIAKIILHMYPNNRICLNGWETIWLPGQLKQDFCLLFTNFRKSSTLPVVIYIMKMDNDLY